MTTQLAWPEAARAHQDTVDPIAPVPHQRAAFASRVTAADFGAAAHRWLDHHSVTLLWISMGAVIFGFGILKYFPGVRSAENLILAITPLLTFGLMAGLVAMALLATVKCAISRSLIASRGCV